MGLIASTAETRARRWELFSWPRSAEVPVAEALESLVETRTVRERPVTALGGGLHGLARAEFRDRLAASDGLCLAHLAAVLDRLSDAEQAGFLLSCHGQIV